MNIPNVRAMRSVCTEQVSEPRVPRLAPEDLMARERPRHIEVDLQKNSEIWGKGGVRHMGGMGGWVEK